MFWLLAQASRPVAESSGLGIYEQLTLAGAMAIGIGWTWIKYIPSLVKRNDKDKKTIRKKYEEVIEEKETRIRELEEKNEFLRDQASVNKNGLRDRFEEREESLRKEFAEKEKEMEKWQGVWRSKYAKAHALAVYWEGIARTKYKETDESPPELPEDANKTHYGEG